MRGAFAKGFRFLKGNNNFFLLGLLAANSSRWLLRNSTAKADQGTSSEDVQMAELTKQIQAEQNISSLNKIVLNHESEYEEGKIYEHELIIKQRKVRVVLVKYKGKFYSLGGTCTYDGESRLYQGVVFGNKLLSPFNGSAYNITTGQVEHGPAVDNLPIYETKLTPEGKVMIFVPDFPPKKVRPLLIGRDFNDLRRVVILGSDPSVISCAETLRQMEYTGEIVVVSQGDEIPLDKPQLRRSIKYIDYDKVEIRDQRYLKDFEVNFIFDNPVQGLAKEKGQHMIELRDGTTIDYDGLVIATGTRPDPRPINGAYARKNVLQFQSMNDHKQLRNYLEKGKVKHLTVHGLNMESLEVVSTIRREYPKVNVTVVDDNPENILLERYGDNISNSLIGAHQQRGVEFILGRRCLSYEGTKPELVDQLHLKGKIVNTDLVLQFPNNFRANTEFIEKSPYSTELKTDRQGRVSVDAYMKTAHGRIFGAGVGSNPIYWATTERITWLGHGTSVVHGTWAAFNLLGLGIPNFVVPHADWMFYGHRFQEVGHLRQPENTFSDGSFDSFDWVSYALNTQIGIQRALGFSGRHPRRFQVLREGLRVAIPELTELDFRVDSGGVDVAAIEKSVKALDKSGCYRTAIFEERFNPLDRLILWDELRMRMGDAYYNFWEHGQLTPGEYMRRQEKDNDQRMQELASKFETVN
jgi:apoptosis-inducing factor 3